jgi:hypothetical protein
MRRALLVIPVLAALAAALGLALPAGASSSTPHPSVHVFGDMRQVQVQIPRTHLQHATPAHGVVVSGNWSGWAVQHKGTFQDQSIIATFNVPSVNCANSTLGTSGFAYDSQWAGLDGAFAGSNTVEQDGVDGFCDSSGVPQYDSWYEMYPLNPVVFTGVMPGDAIQASVRYLGRGMFNLALTDLTQNAGFNVNQSCPAGSSCLKSSAEVISEDPGGAVPAYDLADYGMENFDNARTGYSTYVNTLDSSPYWTGDIEFVMENPSGNVMAAPSGLFGGKAFSTTWRLSS